MTENRVVGDLKVVAGEVGQELPRPGAPSAGWRSPQEPLLSPVAGRALWLFLAQRPGGPERGGEGAEQQVLAPHAGR